MTTKYEKYGVIVIGGGWSGIEAALKAAESGTPTLLIAINLDTIGWIQEPEETMGTDIEKLKADGALLPQITGRAGSIDKRWQYTREAKHALDQVKNLYMRQDTAISAEKTKAGFIVSGASGQMYKCEKLVICAGTFIESSMTLGRYRLDGAGRDNETSTPGLGKSLKKLGVLFNKTKTKYGPVGINSKGKLEPGTRDAVVIPRYEIEHSIIKEDHLKDSGEHKDTRNLYFAGRCTGVKNTFYSAQTGIAAGRALAGKEEKAPV